MPDDLSFLAELKRRKVLRTAALYWTVVLGLWSGLAVASDALSIPRAVLEVVVIASLIAFPAALLAAWFLEVGRDSAVQPTTSGLVGWPIRPVAIGTTTAVVAFVVISLATGNTVPRTTALCSWSDSVWTDQYGSPARTRMVSCSLRDVPIADLTAEFADSLGRTIVLGSGVAGTVTGEVASVPWRLALRYYLLGAGGLVVEEDAYGGILVQVLDSARAAERVEPVVQRIFRLRHLNAAMVKETVQPLLSERGRVSVEGSSNALLVVDLQRVHSSIEYLLAALDVPEDTTARSDPGPEPSLDTLKGQLDWPLEGEILYRFGRNQEPEGLVVARDGIGLRAPSGAPVRSVLAGTVALAGPFEGYGPTVVLSHGNGFYTLYLYLEDIGVAEGRHVAEGQVVGTVGGRDTPEGAHLEFQIRALVEGQETPTAQDPMRWLRPSLR